MNNQFRSVLAMILVAFILLASNALAEKDDRQKDDSIEQPTYSEIQYSALRSVDKVDFGLKLTAEDVTADGLTLICEQSGGVFEGELASTSEFSLDMFDGAKWIVVDTVIPASEIAWTQELLLVQPDGETTWEVDWTNIYGELKPGSYRISKWFMDQTSENTYFAYFTVK
ncbi:MAG: hypothetical protein J6S45_03390 [Firmicutes bacterium]|nr:hypothetical protein [Bacillota bacterium]